MDPKTKQLVERAEGLLLSEDDADRPDDDFVKALCSAVREQDKRARHAEAERDAFGERIKELEKERAKLTDTCETLDAENQRLTKAILEFTELFNSGDPLTYQMVAAEVIKLRRSITVASSPRQTPESR